MNTSPIILFDGICNMCNSAVQFVIKRDPLQVFKFAPLQSEAGQQLLSKYNLPPADFNSFVLIQNDKPYTSSTAALMVTRQLKGLARLLYGFIIVPAFIRNGVYNFISKNRYKWFGGRAKCMVPTPDVQSRFLK